MVYWMALNSFVNLDALPTNEATIFPAFMEKKFLASSLPSSQDPQHVEDLLSQFSDESILKLNVHSHISSQGFSHSSFTTSPLPSADYDVLGTDLTARLARLKAPVTPPVRGKKKDSGATTRTKQQTVENPRILEQGLADSEELDVLGVDLAARWAALKAASSSPLGRGSLDRPHPGQNVAALPPQDGLLRGPSVGSSSCKNHLVLEPLDVQQRKDSKCDASVKQVDTGNEGIDEDMKSEMSDVGALLASLKNEVSLEIRQLKQDKASGKDANLLHETDDSEGEIQDAEVEQVVQWAKDATRLDVSETEDEEFALEETELEQGFIFPSIKDETIEKRKAKGWRFW